MNGKAARFTFLGVCVVLAGLLLTSKITPLVSGAVFAGALIVLGGMSRGFRRS